MRIAIFVLLTLASARLCAQAWGRLSPEGGMVPSLGVDSAGTVYLGTSDGHVFANGDRGARGELRGRPGTRVDAVITRLAARVPHPSHPEGGAPALLILRPQNVPLWYTPFYRPI